MEGRVKKTGGRVYKWRCDDAYEIKDKRSVLKGKKEAKKKTKVGDQKRTNSSARFQRY